MTREERITNQYNKFTLAYDEAVARGAWEDASYYGFMCNAITMQVVRSMNQSLKEYFEKHALTS